MTASELFHEAARRGLTLKPAGSDILAVTPARLCPSEFAHILREHKPDLLALLNGGISGRAQIVRPHRPLTEREWAILVRAGAENDPIIITALSLFNARIVG